MVFYPFFTAPNSGIASVSMLVQRGDGFFYDFNDSTFKDSAWVAKEQALTSKTEGTYILSSGWTIPATGAYRILYKDDSGNIYDGPEIGNNISVLSAAGVQAVHQYIIEGSLTFEQMVRILFAIEAGKTSSGGGINHYRDIGDIKDRFTETVNALGERTAVTTDGA